MRTTRKSKRRSNTTKKVSFSSNVLVCEDDSFSQAERNQMHYTREDFSSFTGAVLQYIDSVRRIEHQSSQPYSSTLLSTGLEGFLHPEHKMKHRLQGVLAVLMEQDRQYMEQGLFTPVDFDSMSHVYHIACQESQQEAHQRALLTEQKLKSEAFFAPKSQVYNFTPQESQEEVNQRSLVQRRVVSMAA
ncbi:unnamed protein product [Cylindrotheca closterium]|uniref:Uncharacterized protein n=1 Tax=Cylindrotheca closterium TaxID=2856 RepID=A0AAD2D0V6_9STRA|nr:unnamed protein product [Cylindrotheca closterium]